MTTLRAARASASAFDPRFFERDPSFWPIARAASVFAACDDWPDVASYARAFVGEAPVRFEETPPKPRRHRRAGATVDLDALYDARIVNDRVVPTRPRCWHDFLNALVWATFPRSKWAVHDRQHRALSARLVPGMTRLPAERTREHDALALIDEGGVVDLAGTKVLFGHALFEGLVLGVRAMVARAVIAHVDVLPDDAASRIALADAALASRLAAPDLVPESLPRVSVREPRGLGPPLLDVVMAPDAARSHRNH